MAYWLVSWARDHKVVALTRSLCAVKYDPESGRPRLRESHGIFSLKFQDLESHGKSLRSWKVLEINT